MPAPVPSKRLRPPNINLALASEKRGPMPSIEREVESPLDLSDDDVFEDTLQLSSSDSDSPSTSPIVPKLHLESSDEDALPDELSQDLAALNQLRKSVQKNLRLRPIRSHSLLPKVNLKDGLPPSPFPPPSASGWRDSDPLSATSTTSSDYFTPISETPRSPPLSTRYLSSGSSDSYSHPNTPPAPRTADLPRIPPVSISSQSFHPIDPGTLFKQLTSVRRPLLIDTRPPAAHLSFHIRHSVNIAIPSLILKRCRKPAGGFQDLEALRQFITTERGKDAWDSLMSPEGTWNGNVVIYDDEMDIKDKENVGVTAWALLPVVSSLLSSGSVSYLEGGLSAAGHHLDLEKMIVTAGDDEEAENAIHIPPPPLTPGKKGRFLTQLDTHAALRSKALPEIEPSSASTMAPSPRSPPRSPMPIMLAAIPPARSASHPSIGSNSEYQDINISDASPSPPPSQIGFRRPPPPPRRPSAPNLRKIDTTSAERLNANLPKLSVRTMPIKAATLAVPPSAHPSNHNHHGLSLQPPTSPSHLSLKYSNHSPPGSARWAVSSSSSPNGSSPNGQHEFFSSRYTPPHTPRTPKAGFGFLPPSPSTARPDLDNPPSTEEPYPVFTVSTILPNFLYLGPELTLQEHVDELKALGVRRILNIAIECDDDQGLGLKREFERYVKIPMRDTVEEDNISRGVRDVCEILDDARLHSAPTYVHCKAGKSRSVTAVMAYLIHANHWTLSQAYAFVLERRKGISPNIGFVSELMTFEEEELGGKSNGVQPNGGSEHDGDGHGHGHGHGGHGNYGVAAGNRRNAHVRESLPPVFVGGGDTVAPMSAGGVMDLRERVGGDSGQEMEIKDASGRYRHARRAPVDETTLQPLRRVSKAGLESSIYLG